MPRLQTGRGARLPAGLKKEIDARITAVHAVMRGARTELLVAACAGAPGQAGWVRNLTGAPLWGPRTFVVVAASHLRRTLITRAPDDTNWYRLTTVDTDIESTLTQKITPLDRLVEIVRARIGGDGRLGVVNPETLSPVEATAMRAVVPESRMVDLTRQLRRLRQVKTHFEIRAMRQTGKMLAQALDRFAAVARPGRLTLEVAGDIDGYLRGQGCSSGYLRYAFNQEPIPGPAVAARRFEVDDCVTLHLSFAGPLGYWAELAGVFSFRQLPSAVQQRIEMAAKALRHAADAIVPGGKRAAASDAAVRAYEASGATVTGRYAPDLHTIGTDEDEDSSGPANADDFEEGMTVAVHPAPLLSDGRGFFLARTYVIQGGRAVPLSPVRSAYRQIAAS
jgi:Xaa-Pro aminopeptidase